MAQLNSQVLFIAITNVIIVSYFIIVTTINCAIVAVINFIQRNFSSLPFLR